MRRPDVPGALHLDAAIERLFGVVGGPLRDGIHAAATVRVVQAGDTLFREGDAGDAAFVVLSGRLRAVAGPPEDERALSDATHGETVGELALLTGLPRSATVYAVRDSTVACIATADFDALLARHPGAVLPITRLLADRLRRVTAGSRHVPPTEVVVAVFGLGATDIEALVSGLASAIEPAMGGADVVRAPDRAETPATAFADALDGAEGATPAVVYAGERGWTAWNDAILRRADEVLLVADATGDPAPGPVEAAVFRPRERGGPRVTLVLRHPPGQDPAGTAAWLAARPGAAHLHVRAGDDADVARVGRWVTGRSVGLVLGGGGARGWSHIGAARALREAGVPVDMIGGTSQGALVGAALADRHTPEELIEVGAPYVRRTRDYTAPVVSLLRGAHILRGIRRIERPGAGVEDLWLPFFAMATNLTRAEPLVIDRGPVSDAIRASVSLPVILPPVVVDGDLIVDGGLLDNLPIGQLRRRMPTGPIIAIDPSPPRSPVRFDDLAPDVSGWGLLRDRVLRRTHGRRVPSIGEMVMRTVVVGSMHLRQRREVDADVLVLTPDLGTWGLLEFEALDVIAEAGYRELREPIRAWWAAQGQGRGRE